jgi:hypothetical protein
MMNRRILTIGLIGVFANMVVGLRRATAWMLITEEQIQNESSAAPSENARPPSKDDLESLVPPKDRPVIEILQPDAKRPIKSPFNVRIRFHPPADAAINPTSFHAKYGWLGIDTTQQLVGHAKIDASGISADNAEIPSGRYSITLQIADTLGRVGTQAIEFSVV